MPLLAGVAEATDMEALIAAGWQVDVAEDETGATVKLTKAFTGATEVEALAAAARHVGMGGGV